MSLSTLIPVNSRKNPYNTNNQDVFWFCVNHFLCMVSLYPVERFSKCDARAPCNCLDYTNMRLIWHEEEPNFSFTALVPTAIEPEELSAIGE